MIRPLIAVVLSVVLSGCLAETEKPFEVPTLVFFSGVYESSENDSQLIFKKGLVEYKTANSSVTRIYRIDEDLVNIELTASSNEKRDDLVMRIQKEGKFLTCNMCPAYVMSNIWNKVADIE